MGAYSGTVVRPSDSLRVDWTLAPALVSCGRDLDALGITWYSIGNQDHLKKQGGHTPWKPSAPYGVVTAIDVMATPDSDVERRVLKVLRSDYDTSRIDFVNTNGSQYDWDGTRQGPSGDYHWHLELLGNRTGRTWTLIRQVWPERFPSTTPPLPARPVSSEQEDVMQLVKLRSRDDVWKPLGGGVLQHLTPKQFAALKANGATVATVDSEEELAGYGVSIIPSVLKVNGL